MAPEQFQGKAVFASDIYSLGVTMYQMLTGVLPYDTPAPADLDKLMRGELASPPQLKNPKLPKAISDIVMKAIAADIPSRYQRAADLLDALLAARSPAGAPPALAAGAGGRGIGRVRGGAGHPGPPQGARNACSPASAGSAASRCTPAPTAARSAASASNGSRPRSGQAELEFGSSLRGVFSVTSWHLPAPARSG